MKRIVFKPFLLSREKEIAGFSYEKTAIAQREQIIAAGLKMPLNNIPGLKKSFPDISLSDVLHENAIEKKSVSMIFIKDGQKIAIINNKVVKEGDLIGQDKVLKINSDSVLLRENMTDKRLFIEQADDNISPKKSAAKKTQPEDKNKPSVIDENLEKIINAGNDKTLKQIEDMKKWLNAK
jgi:hypothetical protein